MRYTKHFSTKRTHQSKKIPGSKQTKNSAGGFAFGVDDWTRLDRFLILGSEGGSYYATERGLTVDSAEAVQRCINADGKRVVERVVEISKAGRAAKNDPAIFVLAMAAKLGDAETRKLALEAVPSVCRIGTHLMHFADFAEGFGGWGRGMRRAVAGWYNDKPAHKLAYQLVKYQARDGWSNRDLLRLSHPKAPTGAHDQLYRWVTQGELASDPKPALQLVSAFEAAKRVEKPGSIVRLIQEYGLPREAIPSKFLTNERVWNALLAKMPMTAMIRNLATMTRVGLLAPMSSATKLVVDRLGDTDRLRKARVHPVALLAALMTYKMGRGIRGKHTWKPVATIVDALDAAFYAAFDHVEPTGKRMLLGLDVSGSMGWGAIAGIPSLTPRVASAAMALVTAATEKDHGFVAFTGGDWGKSARKASRALTELSISPRQRLDDVIQTVSGLPMGPTDCALPMRWALERKVCVDAFVIYTDSETWYGDIHPVQALDDYRQKTGIPAKLVVVGMVSNGFSIADPDDGGMLDVVGFDTRTPPVISDFVR
ncbi:MAG: TROVE domain-containing protein [Deltaproteobacteria bacterium]|nr:TROVE domain-containing protein [Deltaproteobacteria bacterium]